jgi:hypothetical protein
MIEKEDTVYVPDIDIFRETWHGLQTQVEGKIALDGSNIPNVFNPILQVPIALNLEGLGELDLTGENATEIAAAIKKWKVICADCRTNPKSGSIIPLHVPKDGYAIHQNSRLFECMVKAAIAVLGDTGFEIVTVGTLGGYSQFFVSIAIKGQETFDVGTTKTEYGTQKDTWKKFFNLNSSHNGMIASNRMVSMIRVVCMNTVQASISDAENSGTIAGIKHTANSGELITEVTFAKDLEAWVKRSNDFQKALAQLKEQKMTVEEFRNFTAGVFTNTSSDELSTNSLNRIDDMTNLFNKGQGNSGETYYDAVNAFTEYFTSGNGAGSDKVSKAKRIATANFGKGNQWKLQALDVLLNKEAFAETVKRGTILLRDKIAVMVTVGDTDSKPTEAITDNPPVVPVVETPAIVQSAPEAIVNTPKGKGKGKGKGKK